METVCHDKQWDVALAHDDNGNITAALPYLRGKKLGIRYIVQPQLTQYNGPWYRQGADHNYADIQLRAHIRHLRLALFLQNFAPGLTELDGWKEYTRTPALHASHTDWRTSPTPNASLTTSTRADGSGRYAVLRRP